MLRVSPGHYRDTFRRIVFDVSRDRFVAGTKMQDGWRYKLRLGGEWKGSQELFDTKAKARQGACVTIDALMQP